MEDGLEPKNATKESYIHMGACRNILPTLSRLQLERVEIKGMCYLCKLPQETYLHLMFHCPYTRSNGGNFPTDKRSYRGWIRNLLTNVWYGIWNQRNMVWSGKMVATQRSYKENRNKLDSITKILYMKRKSIGESKKWKASGQNLFKVNIDYAIGIGRGMHGLGINYQR